MVGKRETELSRRHRPNTIHHSTTWRAERSWSLISEGAHLTCDFIPNILFCLLAPSLPALTHAQPCSVPPSHRWSPYLEDIASILYLSSMVYIQSIWWYIPVWNVLFFHRIISVHSFTPIRCRPCVLTHSKSWPRGALFFVCSDLVPFLSKRYDLHKAWECI